MENAIPTTPALRIFVVEDSVAIRERLVQLLSRTPGFTVIGHAATAQAAIDDILATRPDAVVLDINLLGGSGLQVLKGVRVAAPDTAFVVLTNHPTDQYRRVFMNAGARAFLDKSTEFEQVPAAVLAGTSPGARTNHTAQR
jgi:DNA-binding NarL/FixJ family response regulator